MLLIPHSTMAVCQQHPIQSLTARMDSPHFDIDEQALGVGVAIFSAALIWFLA